MKASTLIEHKSTIKNLLWLGFIGYPGRKVGVFYQCQYSEELLPSAEHDQSLALAVTEDKVYKF